MDQVKFNSRVKPYEHLVLPIVWMEIAVERLSPGLIVLLHMFFDILPYVQAGGVFVLCIIGVSMFAVAAMSYFCLSQAVAPSKEMAAMYGKCEMNDESAAVQLDNPYKGSLPRCVSKLNAESFSTK